MSVTCEFIVITPGWGPDEESMRAVNLALHIADTQRRQTFNRLDNNAAGGVKHLGQEIWAACFNHFIPDDVIDALCEAEWERPAQVFVYHDPGDYYDPNGGGYGTEPLLEPWAMSITELRATQKGDSNE